MSLRSDSTSRGVASRSVQTQQRDIMPVSKLSELPAGHAWVKTSTGGGTIVHTVRWFEDKALKARITPVLERITEGQRR